MEKARASKNAVHEIDEGGFAGVVKSEQEEGVDGGDFQIFFGDSSGGHPEIAGTIGMKLVADLVKSFRRK